MSYNFAGRVHLRWAVRALALASVYLLVAAAGLRYASIGVSVSPVWPPTGLAIAALLFMGLGYWPAIFAGALLANVTTPIPLLAAIGIACGNTAEAVLAVYILRARNPGDVAIDDAAWVRTYIAVAAPLAALVSAGVGIATLILTDALPIRSFWSALGVWWAGDYAGALVVGSALIAWVVSLRSATDRRKTLAMAPLLAAALLFAAALLLAALVFGEEVPASALRIADFPYLLFPIVVAAALRFGAPGATLTTLAVAVLAVGLTVRGGGPFVMGTVERTSIALLLYICILSVTGLVVSALAAQRRRAESELRDAHQSLRALIDSSPLPIYALDTVNIVRSWNRAAEILFGWRAEEVIGRALPILPADGADQERYARRLLGGEAIRGTEITTTRKDGTPVVVSVSAAPLYDAAHNVTGILSIAADLTELRQLEMQYRHAQKMEAVGRLAGGIAHDFNNILTAILGTASMMADAMPAGSPARDDVHEIEKAARRAAGLTRQLLAFSRQQVLEPQDLDVNALVRDLEPMLHRLKGENVEWRTVLAADAGTVRVDPGQLEQVIVNLVVNARDAMPNGGLLMIETANAELDAQYAQGHVAALPGPYVQIAISDTGTGMDAETRSHLFEPFFTTKGPGKGTGLGLATVYGIVKQSRGYVWAYSELGRGTTFKIYLPRVVAETSRVSVADTAQPSRGSETILLVEDETEVRRVAIRILKSRGFVVLEARDGKEALDVAAAYPERIHLLVTDVVMPGLNGRELAGVLAAERPNVRVLYISGYTDHAIVRGGQLEPGLAFLQKPFTPDALARKVREVLDQQ
jgi:PAS domain S-box-containing protein